MFNYIDINIKIVACEDLIFTSAGDNEHWVYADGKQIGYNNEWTTTVSCTVPGNTKVVAVMIKDFWGGVGGLLGSFSDGTITDNTWKCTRTYSEQWNLATFDDNAWPAAVATRGQEDVIGGPKSDIASNAKWIWAGPYETNADVVIVYCRKKMGKSFLANVFITGRIRSNAV